MLANVDGQPNASGDPKLALSTHVTEWKPVTLEIPLLQKVLPSSAGGARQVALFRMC